jgi:hypothetical protein
MTGTTGQGVDTMSIAISNQQPDGPRATGRRRVREEAGDALAVFAFSAAASSALALAITLVVTLVG